MIVVRVLDGMRVSGPDASLRLGRSRPGALLALLVMHVGEGVPVDRIVDELWPAASATPASKRVQVNVLRLRRALATVSAQLDPAAVVRTHSCGYTLDLDTGRIDAECFAQLVRRGRAELDAGAAAGAAATLREALDLWRGDAYADFAYEPFAAGEIRRLEELRACALESWVEAELALGRHATVAPEIERLIARYPLRERLRALLMIALYRCQRQGDALAAYQSARRDLVDGLGIEPGAELRALQAAILRQSATLELRGGDHRALPARLAHAA